MRRNANRKDTVIASPGKGGTRSELSPLTPALSPLKGEGVATSARLDSDARRRAIASSSVAHDSASERDVHTASRHEGAEPAIAARDVPFTEAARRAPSPLNGLRAQPRRKTNPSLAGVRGERVQAPPEARFNPNPSCEPVSQFTLWQLADSAFPTGGFAHSGGLEAAWQNGEVSNRGELREWLTASLRQVTRASLPFVNAAHAEPKRLDEFDHLCDAFTSNHVANRASRLQGRALMTAAQRVFKAGLPETSFAHLAPAFGAVTGVLGLTGGTAVRVFVFMQLRSAIAAAVRLNIVGPMEGQMIQLELSAEAESVVTLGMKLGLEDLAQTNPLLDLWQGAQDRLYSRLFQS